MRKLEQKVWDRLRLVLDRIPGLEFQRVELKTGSTGIPDVMISYGSTIWVENKAVPSDGDIIDLSGWSSTQRTWTRRHSRAGATVLLYVGGPHSSHLILAYPVSREKYVHVDHSAVLGSWPGKPDIVDIKRILDTVGKIYYNKITGSGNGPT